MYPEILINIIVRHMGGFENEENICNYGCWPNGIR